MNVDTSETDSSVVKAILPGSDWLYFEIYCHPSRSNEILLEDIKELVNIYQSEIKQWFFIRYSKDGHHIRLRLQLKETGKSQEITAAFASLIRDKIEHGIIRDFALRIYRPEYERYGKKFMEAIHLHFQRDSEYVLNLLEQQLTDLNLYQRCVFIFDYIKTSKVFSEMELKEFVTLYSEMFNREHKLDTTAFKALNKEFSRLGQLPSLVITPVEEPLLFIFLESLEQTLRRYEREQRQRIFASLIHMHVNRLFNSKQRVHETAIYYYLAKHLIRIVKKASICNA